MAKVMERLRVVDCDAHMTEMHDIWLNRAPKGYEERVPRVEEVDGRPMWLLDGKPFSFAGAGGTIDTEGNKHPFGESQLVWGIEQVHRAAYDPEARLEMMDALGIDAQVLYPNRIGIGGQGMVNAVADETLRRLCVEIYNDHMAEVQEQSNYRLVPMPILPAWSIEECAREAERCAKLGYRGVNMTSDPEDAGNVDLGNRKWDPLWEVCQEYDLPVHFHIGASQTAMNFYGKYFWESQHELVKPAIGGAMHFINQARLVINSVYVGLFDRHPKLKFVAVESGIGWIPFTLEAMDYELPENAPVQAKELARKPSEYFKDHWYSTFWFEEGRGDLQHLVDQVGEDNILFETDFPHPTCLYPDPLAQVEDKMMTLRPDSRRKIMSENADKLYRL
jgi:predicted TIM-barrel fold metal-dependent hydrolase